MLDIVALQNRFQQWGLEKGWGNTADRVSETLSCLSEMLEAPDPISVEKFFGKVPSIFNIVILSPHGYFGQADVLGLPDTGGQVYEQNKNLSIFYGILVLNLVSCRLFTS